ncbi:MAG TPA: BlaI/MecI/CopY family transcriptional regulator [Thermoanaerobaculia bacterium]|nr:BlaI/MecI/CopY family transcriptional regulator [Thermoanaerobaculia bacterium]
MIRRKSRTTGSDDFLPEAELEVLAVLHEQGEAEAAAIRDALAPYRRLTHASVATLLRRLEDRGLVTRRKADSGRAFVYSATRKAAGTQRGIIERMLQRIFRDRPVSLVASLFEVRTPDENEIAELRSLLDSMEPGKKGKP